MKILILFASYLAISTSSCTAGDFSDKLSGLMITHRTGIYLRSETPELGQGRTVKCPGGMKMHIMDGIEENVVDTILVKCEQNQIELYYGEKVYQSAECIKG